MNDHTPPQNKSDLRKQMRQLRDGQDLEDKKRHDKLINQQLQELIDKRMPRNVHCYLPMGSEVNIHPVIDRLLKDGIRIITPRSLPKRKLEHLVLKSTHELEDGIFGTKHPANSQVFSGTYDLILVPGLAFDRKGNRLGYGAGYYDTFLKDQASAYKVGVAYPFQLFDAIPAEEHDVPLDEIIY